MADVMFVVGIVWLLFLAIASLVGGSHMAAEHAGPLMFGLVFVLPAPTLFFMDALCRRGPLRHQAQAVAPWPAARPPARHPRPAAQAARNPSPPASLASDEPAFMEAEEWWKDERLPTYEEAIREPKLEVLAPGVHYETPAAVFYQVPRPKEIPETPSPSP